MASQWEELFEETLHNLTTMIAGVAKLRIPIAGPIIDSVVSALTTVDAEEAITRFVSSSYSQWPKIVKKDMTILADASLFIPDLSEMHQAMIKGVISSLNDDQIALVWNLLIDKIVIAVEYIKTRREKEKDYLHAVDVKKWDNLHGSS